MRLTAIAIAVTALALALAGTAALAANIARDRNGYFTWPTKTFTSGGYAIAMKSVDISQAPQWAFSKAGLESVEVKASADRPVFIGIARSSDVQHYLGSTEHDDVSHLSYHPFEVNYDHLYGHAPQAAPTAKSFWVKSALGTGSVTLQWKPQPGNWRAVVMNADGSRGVTAGLAFGVRTSLLWWIGAGLLGAALIAAATAAGLYRRARS